MTATKNSGGLEGPIFAKPGIPTCPAPQIIFVIIVALLVTTLANVTNSNQNLGIDFVQYWSAAQTLRAGGNPYNENLLLPIQVEFYPTLTTAIRMWNPPVALTLAMPLSWIEYRTALFIWMNSLVILTGLSVVFLMSKWEVRNLSRGQLYLLAGFLVTFFPAASALAYGQISPLLLAGFVGWLMLRENRPFLSGIALSLTLCKPHLLYLIYLAIFVEALWNKRFSEIFGVIIGAIFLLVPPVLLQPEIISWYIQAATTPPIYFQTPTLGSWLQRAEIMRPEIARILPTILVAVGYLVSVPFKGNHKADLFLLTTISLISSPYGWPFDQILLVPTALAILFSSFRAGEDTRKASLFVISLLIVANLVGILFAAGNGMEIFVWYPAVLALIYLVNKATRAKASALHTL